MKKSVQVRVFLAFTCLFLASTSCLFAGDGAKTLYDKAIRLEQQIKNSGSRQKNLSEWNQAISAFRSVYYKYPASAYCDNALFHVGALYAEMANRFHDPLYFRRACSTYQFLMEQYSSSSLVVDAMLEYIRITRNELKKEEEARLMEARLKIRAPKVAEALSKTSTASSVEPASLLNLRHYTGTDYTRVVLDFDKEVSFKRNRLSDPDRLYFDFEDTIAARELIQKNVPVDDGFLKQIRVGQNTSRRARVVLDLKSLENFEVFSLYHPFRILIDIQGKKSATAIPPQVLVPDTPISPPEMASANKNGQYSLARQLGLKVRRIILDPGHGGLDPGAMYQELREKDITLDVAQRLKTILEVEHNYEVLMTREQDRFVPLEERTAFANSHDADLFISVHVNSSRNRSARGIETYYLNFATTPEAMEVAARENAIAAKNMAELQKLTAAITLNSKIEESRDFASLLQANLVGHLRTEYGASNLGVKQAPFYVLIGAQMPSVLAEISFLSNERESLLLRKSTYRQSIAEGLAKGVTNYIQTLAENKLTLNRKP